MSFRFFPTLFLTGAIFAILLVIFSSSVLGSFFAEFQTTFKNYFPTLYSLIGRNDLYKALGVSRTATEKDINKAFRTLSREWHPDSSKHPNAKEVYAKILTAKATLLNEQKRTMYDWFGVVEGESDGADQSGLSPEEIEKRRRAQLQAEPSWISRSVGYCLNKLSQFSSDSTGREYDDESDDVYDYEAPAEIGMGRKHSGGDEAQSQRKRSRGTEPHVANEDDDDQEEDDSSSGFFFKFTTDNSNTKNNKNKKMKNKNNNNKNNGKKRKVDSDFSSSSSFGGDFYQRKSASTSETARLQRAKQQQQNQFENFRIPPEVEAKILRVAFILVVHLIDSLVLHTITHGVFMFIIVGTLYFGWGHFTGGIKLRR